MRGLLFITLCAACTEGGSSPPSPNLLRNADFEQLDMSNFAAGWQNLDSNPGGEIGIVSEPHLSGERALQWRIDAGDGFEYFIMQTGIPGDALVPGRTYEFTGSYNAEQLGETGIHQSVSGEAGTEPSFSNLSDRSIDAAAVNSWEPFAFEFTIPLETTPPERWEVVIDVLKFTGQPLTITIDDLGLRAKN